MMSEAVTLPRALRDFVDAVEWTFAKTMPEWPHEYTVRDRVDESLRIYRQSDQRTLELNIGEGAEEEGGWLRKKGDRGIDNFLLSTN